MVYYAQTTYEKIIGMGLDVQKTSKGLQRNFTSNPKSTKMLGTLVPNIMNLVHL